MYGPTLLGRIIAICLLLLYVGLAPLLASQVDIASHLGLTVLLWSAAVLMAWRSLRREASVGEVGVGSGEPQVRAGRSGSSGSSTPRTVGSCVEASKPESP